MGRTVGELERSLTEEEFREWLDFFALYPFDDFSRFHRPAALVSIGLAGGDVADRLEWLQPDPRTADMSDVDRSIIKAFSGE